MGLSNLPPGVTLGMIDNNYDEGAWEALIDDIYATKVRMGNGYENLITPEEARERWESQPEYKEFYWKVFPIITEIAFACVNGKKELENKYQAELFLTIREILEDSKHLKLR